MTPSTLTLRSQLVGIYRNFFRQSALLPTNRDQFIAQSELRTLYRSSLSGKVPELQKLAKKAQDKLDFLKIITPKRRGVSERGRFVYRDGKVVEGTAASLISSTEYKDDRIDTTMMERHEKLLRRQHFLEDAPVYERTQQFF